MRVVCIFKNERTYLPEWLAWHRGQGVTHFLLYDNESTDGGVEPAPDVTVIWWRGICPQLNAYYNACTRLEQDPTWTAFIDVDEFLYRPDGQRVADTLPTDLAIGGVAVPWRMFGWRPHETKPPGGVLANYCWRAPDDSHFHTLEHAGKMILRPGALMSWRDPHHVRLRTRTIVDPGLLCNHYWTRSLEEVRVKATIPRVDTHSCRPLEQFLEADINAVYDDRLARLAAG